MTAKVDSKTMHVLVTVTWPDEKTSSYSSAFFLDGDEGMFGWDHAMGSLRMRLVTKEREHRAVP